MNQDCPMTDEERATYDTYITGLIKRRQQLEQQNIQLTTERDALLQQQASTLQELERIDEKLDRVVTVAEQRINALLTERDELRAQYEQLERERNIYRSLFHHLERYDQMERLHWKTREAVKLARDIRQYIPVEPQDAAQYVRGLEVALQPFARMAEGKDEWHASDVCGRFPTVAEVRAARQALAAKEDRG